MKKRILSMLLTGCLLFALVPSAGAGWVVDRNGYEHWVETPESESIGSCSRPARKPRQQPKDGITVSEVETDEAQQIVVSGEGESYLQDILKDGEFVRWIDRVALPDYAVKVYDTMAGADGAASLLIQDDYGTLSAEPVAAHFNADVESVSVLSGSLSEAFAQDGAFLSAEQFSSSSFDQIPASESDRSIDYNSLKPGDVVRTPAYNAIYATSVQKDGNTNYEKERKDACHYVSTAFQAFDRDHPEIFWLSGKLKLRQVTVTIRTNGVSSKVGFIFLVLIDKDGFQMRSPNYTSQAAIEEGIRQRDAAVQAILDTVPTSSDRRASVTAFNRWLTEHNEYNTSADLYSLPNEPHEALCALVGSSGTSGPVCDGYARALKVLCDQRSIPCVLVDGYARSSMEHKGEFHMWNSVQADDNNWYGVDVTWNDPSVKGGAGPKSGRENENFLFVGEETVVGGLAFSASHPPVNRAADGGISFINNPALSKTAYSGAVAEPAAQPASAGYNNVAGYGDVVEGDWFGKAVAFVSERKLMDGISASSFQPKGNMTRAMLVTALYRLAGSPEAGGASSFHDVPTGSELSRAVAWANANGIIEGYTKATFGTNDQVTREQLAAVFYRYASHTGCDMSATADLNVYTDAGSVRSYAADAIRWAIGSGLMNGTEGGGISPAGTATRAQVASMLMNFSENVK